MIVKFDYGTRVSIKPSVISAALASIVNGHSDGLVAGKCHVYLTFFDESGLAYEIVRESDNAVVDYIVREKAYKRIPKNCEYVDTLKYRSGEVAGVIYRKYSQ